ncbi:MAG: hypothetical protein COA42_23730 [Alteromonadaceae bacterium]|nr:MAG: hypothetical protein COA42_23730 [Alteromonadaceae bacterium]
MPWNKKDNAPLASPWGIRLGFCRVKSLNHVKAKNIATLRQQQPFTHINELSTRAQLSKADIKALAAADALYELAGHRYQAHWQAAAIASELPLFSAAHAQIQTKTPIHEQAPSHKQRSNHEQIPTEDKLCTSAPTLQNDIFADYQSTGHSLRPHLMALLRQQAPFSRCKTCRELTEISNGRFVQVAGLVTGRQRPGTAKGTVFVTLEDESGNINVVVWPQTQDLYRQALLQSKLLLVKGRLETKDSVTHIIAGQLHDYSERIQALQLKSRDFH